MHYCVGLTGPAGSGKSQAAAFFSAEGIAVVSADKISRTLTLPGTRVLEQISQHFGTAILTPSGALDRLALRQRLCTSLKDKSWLEALMHPLIRTEIKRQVTHSTSPYCLVELPLLIRRVDYPYIRRLLLIEATKSNQIMRIRQRDHCTRAEALRLLAIQPPKPAYQALADDVVTNNTTLEALHVKLAQIHAFYLTKLCQPS